MYRPGYRNTSDLKTHDCPGKDNKDVMAARNIFLAVLLASKPLVQLISNAFVGPICDKIGFNIPMFTGYIIMIVSSIGWYSL